MTQARDEVVSGPRRGSSGVGLAVLLAATAPGAAASRPPAPACTAEGGQAVTIASVDDDLALRLADGRQVLLAGVDAPADAAGAARGRLAGLVGQAAVLRPVAAQADRWNRLPALVFAPAGPPDAPPLSVALALVDAGLARAAPAPETHECWPALLAAEAGARAAHLGVWADAAAAVIDAADTARLAAATGGLALVEGQVARVGQGRARLYIAFGRRGAFEAHLARKDLRVLTEAGLAVDTLVGRRLRVRGILDDRFGPAIDLLSADQIEVLAPVQPDPGTGGVNP